MRDVSPDEKRTAPELRITVSMLTHLPGVKPVSERDSRLQAFPLPTGLCEDSGLHARVHWVVSYKSRRFAEAFGSLFAFLDLTSRANGFFLQNNLLFHPIPF